MVEVPIGEVVVGSILAKPVRINDVLICNSGIPISESLKKSLPKFGVSSVYVEAIITDSIDELIKDVNSLSRLSYAVVKSLDINKLILCAKSIVSGVVDNDSTGLFRLIYEYDDNTYTHSVNVANIAVVVGTRLGLSVKQLRDLALGALLHDIGKTEIPIEIIGKQGKLSDEEYGVVKTHPKIGYDILNQYSEINSAVKQIVLQHHENYDGSGYPNGLYRLNSFKLARLVHICDVYEALCAVRPYKEAIPRRTVRNILKEGSRTLFDNSILNIFLETVPLYTPGESLVSKGRIGIVVDSCNKDNPDIYFNGELIRLSTFEELGNYDIQVLSHFS